jgi:nucleotide-binding universal stress UspA family protein
MRAAGPRDAASSSTSLSARADAQRAIALGDAITQLLDIFDVDDEIRPHVPHAQPDDDVRASGQDAGGRPAVSGDLQRLGQRAGANVFESFHECGSAGPRAGGSIWRLFIR